MKICIEISLHVIRRSSAVGLPQTEIESCADIHNIVWHHLWSVAWYHLWSVAWYQLWSLAEKLRLLHSSSGMSAAVLPAILGTTTSGSIDFSRNCSSLFISTAATRQHSVVSSFGEQLW